MEHQESVCQATATHENGIVVGQLSWQQRTYGITSFERLHENFFFHFSIGKQP